jgi:cell division ATPase FtsA
MRRQAVLAVDIGSTKVAWAIGQLGLDRVVVIRGQPPRPPFDLLGYGIVPLDPSSGDWPSDPMVLAETLERAMDQAGVSRVPERSVVTFSHPALQHGQVTAHIDLADEPITIRRRDVERVQRLAVTQRLSIDRELLAVEPLGYAGNGFSGVRDPRGLTATRLAGAFHLVTVPVAVRRAILHALEWLGIEVDHLAYSLKALVAGGVTGDHRGERMLLIDLGGSVADLALLDHGWLVTAETMSWAGRFVKNAECLARLQQHLAQFLRQEAPPARAIVTGRAALLDGLIEWIETESGLPASLGRSPWAQSLGDLPQQVALSPVLGMLAVGVAPHAPSVASAPSSRLIDRLLARTKDVLIDYF